MYCVVLSVGGLAQCGAVYEEVKEEFHKALFFFRCFVVGSRYRVVAIFCSVVLFFVNFLV